MADETSSYDRLGYGVHLGDDRAANAAHALPGYPLDVRPAPDWPGLDGSEHVEVRPEVVKQVADWLDARAAETQGLPAWLGPAVSVSFGPATWHEANNLRAASDVVRDAVTSFVARTVENLQQAAASLHLVHATYTSTEQSNDESIRATDGALGDPAPFVD